MNPGLWLLTGLHLRGWLRYLGRTLRTPKGAALALLGAAFFALWLGPALLLPREASRLSPEALRGNGPAALLVYCLFNLLIYSGERSVYFTPAEVSFLFTGPFGRREVLGYKVLSNFLVDIPSTLIFTGLLHVHSPSAVSAFVGLLLMFLFLRLFGMALNLVATTAGARLYGRGRCAPRVVTSRNSCHVRGDR